MSRCPSLWLALRLPDLPLEPAGAVEPIAVVEGGSVVCANAPARAAGVRAGSDAATARLLGCRLRERDRAAEERRLQALAERLSSLTPHLAPRRSGDGRHLGLLLEISTCLRLFGGASAIAERARHLLAPQRVRAALGPTAGAAWLFTFVRGGGESDPERAAARLDALPLDALAGDHPEAVAALQEMGFARLGEVRRQWATTGLSSLERRVGRTFAADFAALYDPAGDRLLPAPAPCLVSDPPFAARFSFEVPATGTAALLPPAAALLAQLRDFLRRRGLSCRALCWRLLGAAAGQLLEFPLRRHRPAADPDGWLQLTRLAWERRPLPFPVAALELHCPETEAWRSQDALDLAGGAGELAVALERLAARLGEGAIHKLACRDSLLPERAQQPIPPDAPSREAAPSLHRRGLRPRWLLPSPRPLAERQGLPWWRGPLLLLAGPERICTHWWEEEVARDYYLALRRDQLPLWVFRDLHQGGWYLHGLFG
ncbi:MAG: hypothetical protein KatS3mg124_1236 [Porticoccaceae bacterium]|nr:MAG: hypothetical protein KatS3mg124_1236 [Porticoccaceae bacterium]